MPGRAELADSGRSDVPDAAHGQVVTDRRITAVWSCRRIGDAISPGGAQTGPSGVHAQWTPGEGGAYPSRWLAIHPFGCILRAELNGRLIDVGDPHVFF